jgi:hypothetical protein
MLVLLHLPHPGFKNFDFSWGWQAKYISSSPSKVGGGGKAYSPISLTRLPK